MKVQESLQALDSTLLFHPQVVADRLTAFRLLWLSDEEEGQFEWMGTSAILRLRQ